MDKLLIFFYNIIPGGLFLIGLQLITNISVYSLEEKDWIYKAIIYSLLVGFSFQAITKLIRNCGLDQSIWRKVRNEDPESFEVAYNELIQRKLINEKKKITKNTKIDKNDLKRIFYLMHNFIGIKGDSGAGYMGQKTAFWSNICIGSFILWWISLYFMNMKFEIFFVLTGIVLISAIPSWYYLRALYDIVLKTFVSIVKD